MQNIQIHSTTATKLAEVLVKEKAELLTRIKELNFELETLKVYTGYIPSITKEKIRLNKALYLKIFKKHGKLTRDKVADYLAIETNMSKKAMYARCYTMLRTLSNRGELYSELNEQKKLVYFLP